MVDINLGALEELKTAKVAEAVNTLHRLGKKKPQVTPNVKIDNSEGYSWGLMEEFLTCYDKGNVDTNALRWVFLSMIGTMKGRDCWINFGGKPLYLNMYTSLIGSPGCGKSTAILIAKELLTELGYPSMTPEIIDPRKLIYYFTEEYKSHKADGLPMGDSSSVVASSARDSFHKSLLDEGTNPVLAFEIGDRGNNAQIMAQTRLSELDHDALAIISSELMGTMPPGSKWFVDKVLIDLFDAHDYERYEANEGVFLNKPIMNILGGITPQGLAKTFSVEDFNTGLLTRMMLVHVKDINKGDPWEQVHDFKASTELLSSLGDIYSYKGEISVSSEAKKTYKLITTMQYNSNYDIRLSFYYNRRSLFLVKVSGIIALIHGRTEILKADMITANTLLLYTEFDMPKALTEFGNTVTIKVRNAIIDYLEIMLHKSIPVHSVDIIEAVSAKLGISKDEVIITAIQKLVSTGLISALLSGTSNQYILDRPKNTDILEAMKAKVADPKAIPEWSIIDYANEEAPASIENSVDWNQIEL